MSRPEARLALPKARAAIRGFLTLWKDAIRRAEAASTLRDRLYYAGQTTMKSAGLDGHQVGKLRPHDYFIGAGGQHEVQTAPLVQFECGGHVEVGNLNLPGP